MRVLHAPEEIAGQLILIARAQRALGVKSDVLVFRKHPFGYECDICLDLQSERSIVKRAIRYVTNFIWCLRRYDIFHFHVSVSLLPYNLDLPILKLLKKKVIMHYWGSDIRQYDLAVNYLYHGGDDLREVFDKYNPADLRRKINRIEQYVDVTIVGDYSLLPYSPNSMVVKQAIDLNKYDFKPLLAKKDRIVIVHVPSNRVIKGTKYIFPVIDRLRAEGYDIEFNLLERRSHEEVLTACMYADIVIDQLLLESYGILAIECMAMGKPVLCRIDGSFLDDYPDLPILNTDPSTLYDNLRALVSSADLRKQLGEAGRRYAEMVHDSKKIASQLIDIYNNINR